MRTDPVKGEEIRNSPALEGSAARSAAHIEQSAAGEHSLSGHEIDRFFYNDGGQNFVDLSGLSGMDDEGDGRSVALWDYDRDGWTDVVTTNANSPQLLCYRNRFEELRGANWVALRAVGGNWTAVSVAGLACRDGYGARAELRVSDKLLVREWRCGEGFAAQNSATLIVGLGESERVDLLTVIWPSGRRQEIRGVEAGRLITAYEDPQRAPGGEGFVEQAYTVEPAGD